MLEPLLFRSCSQPTCGLHEFALTPNTPSPAPRRRRRQVCDLDVPTCLGERVRRLLESKGEILYIYWVYLLLATSC